MLPAASITWAQSVPDVAAMRQMLDASQRRSQLETPGAAPYHMVVTMQAFDADGKPTAKATLDKVWKSPHEFRQTFTLPALKTTTDPDGKERFADDYSKPQRTLIAVDTETQGWRTGKQLITYPWGEGETFYHPFVALNAVRNRLTFVPSANAQDSLDCIDTEPDLPGVADDIPIATTTFCLSKGSHLLRRIVYPNGREIVFNDVQPFGQKFIARSITVAINNIVRINIHVNLLEPATDTSSISEAPPPDAQVIPFHRSDPSPLASGELLIGQILKHPDPFHAADIHLRGTITVKIHLDETGVVKFVDILQADNPVLRAPVETALKAWRFRASYRGNRLVPVDYVIVFNYGYSGWGYTMTPVAS
jgi:Gram-negative bacterial TonB protein C-terminal